MRTTRQEGLSPVLDALGVAERNRVLDRTVPRRLVPGDRLYLAGDRSSRVHLLVSGVVKLGATSPTGEETILCLATRGEILGDIAALDGLAQPLDAIAVTRCELKGMDAELLLDALKASATASVALAEMLAGRLRWMAEAATERTTSPATARMAGRLLGLADVVGKIDSGSIKLDVPLDQTELALLAGMCRETACRTLRRFKAAGVVEYDRKKRLRILRPEVLERVRCMGGPLRKARG